METVFYVTGSLAFSFYVAFNVAHVIALHKLRKAKRALDASVESFYVQLANAARAQQPLGETKVKA